MVSGGITVFDNVVKNDEQNLINKATKIKASYAVPYWIANSVPT